VFGRDPRLAQVVFAPEVDDVSKRHCGLTYDRTKRSFMLEDYYSTNGTFDNNGRKVEPGQPAPLHPGDRFFLSDREKQFEVQLRKRN
jgi:pSer/pThr/pTyr-binding forkhead associated (FHA) protein